MCECLGAKIDCIWQQRKALHILIKPLASMIRTLKIKKQSLSVIVHRPVSHLNRAESMLTPARQ